jgi:hypothetical protein
MWHPNSRQWPAIWIAVCLALGLWLADAQWTRWGFVDSSLKMYTESAPPYARLAVAVAVLGAVAVWQRAK